jgi:hypothetical protein
LSGWTGQRRHPAKVKNYLHAKKLIAITTRFEFQRLGKMMVIIRAVVYLITLATGAIRPACVINIILVHWPPRREKIIARIPASNRRGLGVDS